MTNVMRSNSEVIPHRFYKQRLYTSVASYKQVFNKGTSIPLTCTYLPQNLKCVKKNMFSIKGNRSNLLPLQYVHFIFQPVLTLYIYSWDIWDHILSLNLSKPMSNHNKGAVRPI